jgi:hypothetical protein
MSVESLAQITDADAYVVRRGPLRWNAVVLLSPGEDEMLPPCESYLTRRSAVIACERMIVKLIIGRSLGDGLAEPIRIRSYYDDAKLPGLVDALRRSWQWWVG